MQSRWARRAEAARLSYGGVRARSLPTPRKGIGLAREAAEQAGDVGGGGVDVHGAEVDEAGDFVAGEEHVVVPDVAQAGLQWERNTCERFELGDGTRHGVGNAATNWRASGASSGQVASVTAARKLSIVAGDKFV